mgnify:CR=1 FL=1
MNMKTVITGTPAEVRLYNAVLKASAEVSIVAGTKRLPKAAAARLWEIARELSQTAQEAVHGARKG